MKRVPLKSVLKVRAQKVKVLQRELAAIQGENRDLLEEMEKLERDMEGSAYLRRIFPHACLDQEKQFLSLQKQLFRREESILKKQRELEEATQARKSVEKIQSKHYTLLNQQQLREETHFLDEIALNSH